MSVRARRRWRAACARIVICASLLAAVPAWLAAQEVPFATPLGSAVQITGLDVVISIQPIYDSAPAEGYLPVRITVFNRSNEAGRWTVRFESVGGGYDVFTQYNTESSLVYATELSAEPGATRSFDVLVPLLSAIDLWSSSLDVTLTGSRLFDVEYRRLLWNRLDPNLPAVLFTADFAESFANVQEQQDPWQPLPISKVALPAIAEVSSWRWLLGFQALWISGRELEATPPEARAALADWVLQGGHLLCGGDPESLRRLPIPAAELARGHYGFGRVTQFDWDGQALSRGEVLGRVSGPYRPIIGMDQRIDQRIPPLEFGRATLAVFVIVLTALIGPINVLYLAGAQRARLLVTTPLIAAGASVVLALLIFVDEGVGGTGTRAAVHLLMPESGREVVMQEQTSRTGVLVRRSFSLADDVWMARYRSAQDPAVTLRFQQREGSRSGDWFRTRAVQAHHVVNVRASRARVELVGRDGDGRPEVLSSLPATLDRLHYVDADGGVWFARDVVPGTRVVLESADAVPGIDLGVAPGPIADAIESIASRSDYFYGEASRGDELAIGTLSAIDWAETRALYVGPIVRPETLPSAAAAAHPMTEPSEVRE